MGPISKKKQFAMGHPVLPLPFQCMKGSRVRHQTEVNYFQEVW